MSDAPGDPVGRGRLLRATLLVAVLTGTSQLLGFLRDTVIAAVFGVDAALDAYLVAQGLMNLVLGLIAGAVAKSVVPVVTASVEAGEHERGHRSAQTALTVVGSVLVAGSAVMYVASDAVIAILAPGFDADTAAIAERLTRIVLVATVFIAGTNILAAAAQAHRRFFWPAFQGIPFNLVMIAAAALFGRAHGVTALAVGFVVGSAARFAVQLPAIRSVGMRFRLRWNLRDEGFGQIVAMLPLLLIGSALVNVNTVVDRAVGSGEAEGTIAALSYGWRIVTIADTLIAGAMVTALYPAFSAAASRGRRTEMRELTGRGTLTMLVLLAPVVAVLVAAARPIVILAFGRGAFDEHAISVTTVAVVAFAAALVGVGVRELLARAFYALGDTGAPVRASLIGMVVNVVGDLTLGRAFGVAGLAGSTSASVLVVAALMLYWLHRAHGAVDARRVAAGAGRVTLAAGGAAVLAALTVRVAPAGPSGDWQAALLSLLAGGVVGAVTYVVALTALRAPELKDAIGVVVRLARRQA